MVDGSLLSKLGLFKDSDLKVPISARHVIIQAGKLKLV